MKKLATMINTMHMRNIPPLRPMANPIVVVSVSVGGTKMAPFKSTPVATHDAEKYWYVLPRTNPFAVDTLRMNSLSAGRMPESN